MRKLILLLLYGAYFAWVYISAWQEGSTGHADARYLLIAVALLPLWGIPLVKKIYRAFTKRGRR
jgi:hypothetical protein